MELPATAGSTERGTAIDHLYRRGAYWRQRRVPAAVASDGPRRLARSLRAADPVLVTIDFEIDPSLVIIAP